MSEEDKKPSPPSEPIFDNVPPGSTPSNESIRESVRDNDTIRDSLPPPDSPPTQDEDDD